MASEEEQFTLTKGIDDIAQTRRDLEQHPRSGYIDLSKEEFPCLEETAETTEDTDLAGKNPQYRLVGKRDHRSIIYKEDDLQDEWYYDEQLELLVRFHRQPRDWPFTPDEASADCPIPVERIGKNRHTFGKYVNTGQEFQKEDQWEDQFTMGPMTPWTGRTEFDILSEDAEETSRRETEERLEKRPRISSTEQVTLQ